MPPPVTTPTGTPLGRTSSFVNNCHSNRFGEAGHKYATSFSAFLAETTKRERIFTRKTWQGRLGMDKSNTSYFLFPLRGRTTGVLVQLKYNGELLKPFVRGLAPRRTGSSPRCHRPESLLTTSEMGTERKLQSRPLTSPYFQRRLCSPAPGVRGPGWHLLAQQGESGCDRLACPPLPGGVFQDSTEAA